MNKKHRYFDRRITFWGAHLMSVCEHCDGEHETVHRFRTQLPHAHGEYERAPLVRHDDLRGWVCPACDSTLDEMLDEEMKVTADTITDAQIYALGKEAHETLEAALEAMSDYVDGETSSALNRRWAARARCAQILNSKGAK